MVAVGFVVLEPVVVSAEFVLPVGLVVVGLVGAGLVVAGLVVFEPEVVVESVALGPALAFGLVELEPGLVADSVVLEPAIASVEPVLVLVEVVALEQVVFAVGLVVRLL